LNLALVLEECKKNGRGRFATDCVINANVVRISFYGVLRTEVTTWKEVNTFKYCRILIICLLHYNLFFFQMMASTSQ